MGLKILHFGKSRGKIEILSTHNRLCWTVAADRLKLQLPVDGTGHKIARNMRKCENHSNIQNFAIYNNKSSHYF